MSNVKTIEVRIDPGDSGKNIALLESGMQKLAKGVKLTADEIEQLNKISKSVKAGLSDIEQGANKTNGAFDSIGRSAGAAGIQIQQFVGQVQGGVNPLLAFSQQGADLGIVLGAPLIGTIVSLGAALALSLSPSLFSSTDNMKKFNEQLDIVKAKATLSIDGTLNFSESLLALSKVSKEATRALLELTLEQNKIAQSRAAEAIKKQFQDAGGFFDQFGKGGNLATDALRGIGTQAGLTEREIEKLARTTSDLTNISRSVNPSGYVEAAKSVLNLQQQIDKFNSAPTLQNALAVQEALNGIKVSGNFATESARQLAEAAFQMVAAFAQGEEVSTRLKGVLNSGDLSFDTLKGGLKGVATEADELAGVMERLRIAEQALRNVNTESFKTEQMKAELLVRQQLAAGDLTQQQANEQIALQNLMFSFEQRRNAILENDRYTHEQKMAQVEVLNEQEVIAQELLQQRLDDIARNGNANRLQDLENSQANALAAIGGGLNSLANIESKDFERQKKLRKASVIASTASAIMKTWDANGGYPYAIGPSIAMALAGAAQLKAINSTSASGGGSISRPTASSVSSSQGIGNQQTTYVNLTGVRPDEFVRADQIPQLFAGNDNIIVSFANGLDDAKRRGVISG